MLISWMAYKKKSSLRHYVMHKEYELVMLQKSFKIILNGGDTTLGKPWRNKFID